MHTKSNELEIDRETFALVEFTGIRHVLSTTITGFLISVTAAALVCFIYWQGSGRYLGIWLALVVLAGLVRVLLFMLSKRYLREAEQYLRWKILLILSAAFTGAAWGLSLPLAQINGSLDLQIAIALITLAASAAVVGSLSAIKPAFLVMLTLMLVGLGIGMYLSDHAVLKTLSPFVSLYFLYLLNNGLDFKRTFAKAIVDRRRAENLSAELLEEKRLIEILNQELHAEIDSHKSTAEKLKWAIAAAELANRAKNDFISSMSHELRTPMNGILGFGQLLQMSHSDPLTEKQSEHVDHILEAGGHLLELINQILDFSQIQQGEAELEFEDVDPRPAIDNCLSLITSNAAKHNIMVTDRTADIELPKLRVDQTRFKQVLINLLSNAVKYNRPGGSVTIEGVPQDCDRLRLLVTDTGIGIPSARQKGVFEPFNRLGQELTETQGTGIGLSICRELVEAMDGKIGFESRESEGSTFWIDLPVAPGVAPEQTSVPIPKFA